MIGKIRALCALNESWSDLRLGAQLCMHDMLWDKGFDISGYLMIVYSNLVVQMFRKHGYEFCLPFHFVGIDRVFCGIFFGFGLALFWVNCVCDREGTLQVSPKRVYLV